MPAVQLGPMSWVPYVFYKGQVNYRADLPVNPAPGDEWFVLHENNVGYYFVWDGTAWVVETGQVQLPENALLTDLLLGVIRWEETPHNRWLRCGCKTLVGQPLQLGEEKFLGTIVAPANYGGSARLSVPDGSVVSALKLVGLEALGIWYRQYIGPADFRLGPEQPGIPTKEPRTDGNGNLATEDGCTMTAFQLQKDPDQTLAINIMYRPVL